MQSLIWGFFSFIYQIFNIPSKPPIQDIDFRLASHYRQRLDGTRRSLVEAQRRYRYRGCGDLQVRLFLRTNNEAYCIAFV